MIMNMLMKLINNSIKCKVFFFIELNLKRFFYSSGYNMGVRLIDDFLSRNPNVGRCHDFRETADVLAKVKMLIL